MPRCGRHRGGVGSYRKIKGLVEHPKARDDEHQADATTDARMTEGPVRDRSRLGVWLMHGNSDRKVIYMGALDDKDDPDKVTIHYLEEALAAAQAGKTPAKTETLARGCMIRYKKRGK